MCDPLLYGNLAWYLCHADVIFAFQTLQVNYSGKSNVLLLCAFSELLVLLNKIKHLSYVPQLITLHTECVEQTLLYANKLWKYGSHAKYLNWMNKAIVTCWWQDLEVYIWKLYPSPNKVRAEGYCFMSFCLSIHPSIHLSICMFSFLDIFPKLLDGFNPHKSWGILRSPGGAFSGNCTFAHFWCRVLDQYDQKINNGHFRDI